MAPTPPHLVTSTPLPRTNPPTPPRDPLSSAIDLHRSRGEQLDEQVHAYLETQVDTIRYFDANNNPLRISHITRNGTCFQFNLHEPPLPSRAPASQDTKLEDVLNYINGRIIVHDGRNSASADYDAINLGCDIYSEE